ncbi:MAG: GspE/PulE family protein [Proteobacteria bacterium]|nr:GspE/PulE family protein [Pseudomonadota bacterium]MBU1711969.1 GspE/PulE family protein [Pseudomonadota bacterium]
MTDTDKHNPLSSESVCRALLKKRIISREQIKETLEKMEILKRKIEKSRLKQHPSGIKTAADVSIIDIIASQKYQRADGSLKVADEDTIFQALAEEWGLPFKKIDPLKLNLNLVTTTIPRSFAMRHKILPVSVENGCLTVATPDPFNVEVFDDIARAIQMRVIVVVSSKSDIVKLIDEFFGFKRSIAAAEHQFAGPSVDLGNLEQYFRLSSPDELPSNDKHIINAVNHLFSYAFDQRASDIHIEPKRNISLVRMRIDGVLHTVYELPKNVHSAVISRIKNLSRLDMAEKRRPQDGRIKTDKGSVAVEIRVSTLPVAFGEKVVMRIMDPDVLFQDLENLGFTPTDLIRYNQFVNIPHGIVLVCGPTGSGKSTTLYSTLRQLSSPGINITTIEDPIEMIHEDFNQIAVQPAVDITFATILRNILRQDPDIIMIGEMRDVETAHNAIQAAMTGHLVLSTLHTNDAPSTITRLLDLGVPPFLIQATLVGVLGQRLVRKICTQCSEQFEMESNELNAMGLEVKMNGIVNLHRGKGCINCRGTGYFGRTSIFEVLPYSETIKKMTTADTDLQSIRTKAREEGMVTLRENAVKKLLKGITTYQEVLRVTWEKI